MHKVLLILLLLISFITDGQNKTDAAGQKQGHWVKTDSKTGKKIYEGDFKNDKPLGTFKYYYPGNDSLRTIMVFRPDGKTALATMYHLNGKMQAKGKYVNEQKDSVWNYYDETSKLLSVENYSLGKKNGKALVYYQNGNLAEEKTYKLDVLEGAFKQYYDNKKVKGEGAYSNSQFIGKCSYYYPNGVVAATGVYEKGGIKKGIWIYKTIENKLESREIWVNGKQLNDKEAEEYVKRNKAAVEAATKETNGKPGAASDEKKNISRGAKSAETKK